MANDARSKSEIPKKNKRRIPIGSADGWTAIGTIFLVIVGAWGVCEAKNALELSQRAWVTSLSSVLTSPIEDSKAVHFGIMITNSGHEPAKDVNIVISDYLIDSFEVMTADMRNISIP